MPEREDSCPGAIHKYPNSPHFTFPITDTNLTTPDSASSFFLHQRNLDEHRVWRGQEAYRFDGEVEVVGYIPPPTEPWEIRVSFDISASIPEMLDRIRVQRSEDGEGVVIYVSHPPPKYTTYLHIHKVLILRH